MQEEIPATGPSRTIVAEVDGTMVPIRVQPPDGDARKRECIYKEARLSLAQAEGAKQLVFGATLGGPQEAGKHLLNCAVETGFNLDIGNR